MFEEYRSQELLATSTNEATLVFDDLNSTQNEINQLNAAQTALATGIGAALISRGMFTLQAPDQHRLETQPLRYCS